MDDYQFVKKMTNRDWLNGLSNEELAEFIRYEFGGDNNEKEDFIKWLEREKSQYN